MNRCKRLVAELKKQGFDAALIHKSENMRYLTGYTGEGSLLVFRDSFGTAVAPWLTSAYRRAELVWRYPLDVDRAIPDDVLLLFCERNLRDYLLTEPDLEYEALEDEAEYIHDEAPVNRANFVEMDENDDFFGDGEDEEDDFFGEEDEEDDFFGEEDEEGGFFGEDDEAEDISDDEADEAEEDHDAAMRRVDDGI